MAFRNAWVIGDKEKEKHINPGEAIKYRDQFERKIYTKGWLPNAN
jgi:hypothetical protein